MKKLTVLPVLLLLLCLTACGLDTPSVVASTAPIRQFAEAVCEGTPLEVGLIVSDSVSCLHDYSLSTRQMIMLEHAEVVILSGTELESFLTDALQGDEKLIECGAEVPTLEGEEGEPDPHIWLSPDNARLMTQSIADGLSALYPEYSVRFHENADAYCEQLTDLQQECAERLSDLSNRGIITFHDGFAYFAACFDLEILAAIEEESGAEASAKELKEMVALVRDCGVPCVFTEKDGSVSAAYVIAGETGCEVRTLSTGLDGTDYCEMIRGNVTAVMEGLR